MKILNSAMRGKLEISTRSSNVFVTKPGHHVHVTDSNSIKHGYDYASRTVEEAMGRAVADFENCDCPICEDLYWEEMTEACQPKHDALK